MEKDSINKKTKAILFLSFYFVFFLVLILVFKQNNIPLEEENVSVLTINELVNLPSYQYYYEIDIDDDIIHYSGTKNNVDYLDFENNYFLNPINVNQLIKKSKFVGDKTYELSNDTINNFLETSVDSGINKITINENKDTLDLTLDISAYMNHDKYIIKLNYQRGDSIE